MFTNNSTYLGHPLFPLLNFQPQNNTHFWTTSVFELGAQRFGLPNNTGNVRQITCFSGAGLESAH